MKSMRSTHKISMGQLAFCTY